MFCTNCGAELKPGSRFCTRCGARVTEPDEVSEEVSDTDVNLTPKEVEICTPKESKRPEEPPKQASMLVKEDKRLENKNTASVTPVFTAVIIALLAVCVCIGVIIYRLVQGDSPDNNNTSSGMVSLDISSNASTADTESVTTAATTESVPQAATEAVTEIAPSTEEDITLQTEAENTEKAASAAKPVNVDDEVAEIRKLYYGTQDNLGNMKKSAVSDSVASYSEDGTIRKIVCNRGTDGIDYSREYYYDDGKLYFAFVYKGTEEHRLYYCNDELIRYIDEKSNIYDGDNASEYVEYASGWQKEAYHYLSE